ncbi:MAG TPA: YciI family protein [Anseongella sp.]
MRKFALIFREVSDGSGEISKEEMEKIHHQWKEWSDGIISQDRLESRGARLGPEGKVLKSGGVISDGPFVEIRERLGGFVIVRAESLEDATTLAHGCPILKTGGSVEIRPV